MDVLDFINRHGNAEVPNPNYNPKSKKNKEPKTITVDDLNPRSSIGANFGRTAGLRQYSIDKETMDRYAAQGVAYNPYRNIDRELADRQSAWSKWGNALAQTVISEVGLGTAVAFSDLFDIVTGATFRNDNDYSNPVTQFLEEKQEEFRNWAPVNVAPGTNIGNGGLMDAGWWASNVPSIASSLTLLIPSKAAMAVPKLLGKIGGVNKTIQGGRKAIKAASRLDKVLKGEKVGDFSVNTINAFNRMSEAVVQGGLMRAMENYQEGRQTYNEIFSEAVPRLNNMSDEEYQQWLQIHQDELGEDVDLNDRTAVAKSVAKASADKTFQTDWLNIVFDVGQVYALRNPMKFTKNMRKTSEVAKAERLAKRNAGKTAEQIAEMDAAVTRFGKVKNYVGDRLGATGAALAEFTEGIEEAVNYVANQEGLHYGRNMLNPNEEVTSQYTDRLKSYFQSPELYDAAFFGFLGGVAFQVGGSKIQQVERAAGIYKDAKKKGNPISWSQAWKYTENVARVNQIQESMKNIDELTRKLNMINDENDPRNPYAKDEQDNSIYAKFSSEIERDLARKRAVEEYINQMTVDAMDNGNFDIMKSILRDKNVAKLFEQNGAQSALEEGSTSIESLIAQMDKTAKLYDDNLIAVNSMSKYTDMPFEYMQIIARDNTFAQLEMNRLDQSIAQYEGSAANNVRRFGSALDESIDYKGAVNLLTIAQRLGILRSQRSELVADKELLKSASGQEALRAIDSEINTLNDYLLGSKREHATSDALAKLLWATGVSKQIVKNADGSYGKQSTDDYLEFLQAVASRDKKRIARETGIDFETTDEELMKLFGEEGQEDSSAYNVTTQELNDAYDETHGLQQVATPLYDDYANLAIYNLAKLQRMAKLYNTPERVNARIQELHNYMNEERKAAVDSAKDTLRELGNKYGNFEVADHVLRGEELNMSNEDRTKLDEAMTILNLTNPDNSVLIRDIDNTLLHNEIMNEKERANGIAEESQSSTTSENQNRAQQNAPLPNSVAEVLNEQNEPQNGQIEQSPAEEEPLNTENGKLIITTDADGNITTEIASESDNRPGVKTGINTNADTVLYGDTAPVEILQDKNLFEGYDENETRPYKVTNAILTKDDNGKWQVKRKGVVEYYDEQQTSSTGEREQTSNQSTTPNNQAASTSTTNTSTTVTPEQAAAPVDDSEAEDDFRSQIAKDFKEVDDEIKNADDKKAKIEEIVQRIKEKYADNKAIYVNKIIEQTGRNKINRLTRRGLASSIAEMLERSSELQVVSPTKIAGINKEYIDAVKQLLEDYFAETGIREIDGKHYINLENLLRKVNDVYEDKTTASMIAFGLHHYLMNNPEAQAKYTIIDGKNNVAQTLENANKSVEQRITELIGNQDSHRVSIDKILDTASKEVKEIFNGLNVGDKLGVTVNNGTLQLTMKGKVIGELPTAKVDSKTGGYYKYNRGWRTDVRKENGSVVSSLRDTLASIILDDTEVNHKIIDGLTQLKYGKLDDNQKAEKIEEIYKLLTDNLGLTNNTIDTREPHASVVMHLGNLLDFAHSINDNMDERNQDRINASLDSWANKLYNSYEAIEQAIIIASEDPSKLEIEVAHMNSGKLIRNVGAVKSDRNNYDKFIQSTQAIADIDNADVAIVNPYKEGEVWNCNGITEIKDNFKKGTVYVAIPNKNGTIDYVISTAARLDDKNLKGDIKEIISSIKKELKARIADAIESNDPTKLIELLSDLTYNNAIKGQNVPFGVNIPLLYSRATWHTLKFGRAVGYDIGIADKFVLTIYTTPLEGNNFAIRKNDEKERKLYSFSEDSAVLESTIDSILENSTINVDQRNIQHARGELNQLNGLLHNLGDGKIELRIPSITGNDIVYTYDSYKDFLIRGGMLRCDTHISSDNTNYERKDDVTGYNQTLEVKMSRVTSSPVEEAAQSETPTTDAETILKDDTIEDKAQKLMSEIFDEKQLKLLENLHLLPKNVIFAEDLNIRKDDGNWAGDNALAELDTGKTYVGRRWLDMFNEQGEFSGYAPGVQKAQAVRKLIHEQLHHRLNNRHKATYLARIEEIYNEFKQSLEGKDEDTKKAIGRYLFENDSKEVALEEFLVESLTSKELVDYLNSVEAKVEKSKLKNNLWQKIFKLLSDIFGWDVKEGSLREKELYTLQKEIKAIEDGTKQVTKPKQESSKKDQTAITPDTFFGQSYEELTKEPTEQVVEEKNTDTTVTESATESNQEPVVEQKNEDEDIPDMPDFDFFDTDKRGSSVTEQVTKDNNNVDAEYPSVSAFAETMPVRENAEFVASLLRGDVSMSCR